MKSRIDILLRRCLPERWIRRLGMGARVWRHTRDGTRISLYGLPSPPLHPSHWKMVAARPASADG